MAYALGPVKPWVRTAAENVGGRFGVRTIYGVASRSYASDHPLGLALDFMVYSDSGKGTAIAQYVQSNARAMGVTYVIWNQHIWSTARSGEGWRPMEDRGSPTANHMDHVHVSFSASGAGSGAVGAGLGPDVLVPPGWGWQDDATKGVGEAAAILAFLTSSAVWVRVMLFAGGLVLLLIGLVGMGRAASAVTDVVRKVK